jgi:ribonuclease D
MSPTITVCQNDLPSGIAFPSGLVAVDTETTGLDVRHVKLCLVQVADGLGNVWLIQFLDGDYTAPNLRAVLENPRLTKLFHFARFDAAMLQRVLGIGPIAPLYCSKIASKLLNPDAPKHNLRSLVQRYAGVELDKTEQLSDWTVAQLSDTQKLYAANDVLYLHNIFTAQIEELAQAGLNAAQQAALQFLSTRIELDLAGHPEGDLFAH